MSSNDDYFDSAVRHSIGVQRFSAGEIRRILTLLARADVDLVARIRKRMRKLVGKPIDVRSAQLKELLKEIANLRVELLKKIRSEVRTSLLDFAKVESDLEEKLITAALPIEVELAGVEAAVLRAAVISTPFAGGPNAARTLQQWFQDLAQVDRKRLVGAIQMSLVQGDSIEEAIQRVAGTRANGYRDGVLAISRRNAESIVRTAINHVSNAAREAVWNANSELIDGLRWTSTLDGRTTKICQSRDGKVAPIGGKPIPRNSIPLVPSSARPPAHIRCRSLMTAVIDVDGVALLAGERPFVIDARTGRKRQRDFRAEAKSEFGDRWGRMSRGQRDAAIRQVRREWASRSIGQVPAVTTYGDWLARQTKAFQVDVLGPARAKLFRDGGLTLDAFVDRRGNELTLAQLAKAEPGAFVRAGLR